ncbi:MAG: sulfotransferase family protein [Bacteroidota bacterium]
MRVYKFLFHQYSKLMHFYFHQLKASAYEKKIQNELDAPQNFVLFLGYPRSGHTLLGSMLNAHPDVLIAHEYHALQKQRKHKTAASLYSHLFAQNKWFSSRGFRWTGYSYSIPTGWQNNIRELKVIGDKRGGASSRILYKEPERLDHLQQLVKIPLKLIIVHRNPFDNIATRARGGNYYRRKPSTDHINKEITRHFRDVETIDKIKKQQKYDYIELTHEDFIQNPENNMTKICGFLNITADKDFIRVCKEATHSSGSKSRNKISWTNSQIQQINQQISRYDFLKDYTFEE